MILWEIININKIINLNLCKIISLRYYLPKLTLHIKKLNKKKPLELQGQNNVSTKN